MGAMRRIGLDRSDLLCVWVDLHLDKPVVLSVPVKGTAKAK